MKDHYSDYQKKSVSADSLTFDKIGDKDSELISRVRKDNIRRNIGFLILLLIVLLGMTWALLSVIISHINTIAVPHSGSSVFQTITVCFQGCVILVCIYFLRELIGFYNGIRKGVVLTSSRINDGKVYLHVFDIYMEDKDETLMNFTVRKDVFQQVRPGDGVLIVRSGRKIKVLPDPDRRGVMDVSNIRSGI